MVSMTGFVRNLFTMRIDLTCSTFGLSLKRWVQISREETLVNVRRGGAGMVEKKALDQQHVSLWGHRLRVNRFILELCFWFVAGAGLWWRVHACIT